MTGTFQYALDHQEIADFFKGNGIYFARGCDWGDHLYIGNWQAMCAVLKHQDSAREQLTRLFGEYVASLDQCYVDAEGLLCTITAYSILRKTNAVLCAGSYDLFAELSDTHKKTIGALFRLLRGIYDRENAHLPKYSFDQELERLKSHGCTTEFETL